MPTPLRLRAAGLAAACLAALLTSPAAAQLRPLEPMDWRAFDRGTVVLAQVGGGVFFGQRASIGQIRGRLLEAPAAVLSWTTGDDGRVALRAIIHPLRLFRVDSTFGAALPGTTEITPRISDAGDNGLETIVRLTPGPTGGSLAAVRWGVKLSTHNGLKGLDRHKTDFYATLGGRLVRGDLTFAGEAGLGVWGTREAPPDKAIPFQYNVSARWHRGALEPALALVGQGAPTQVRGNEDLAEVRAGLRAGRRHWVEASLVRGLAQYGPRWGGLVFVGLRAP